MQQTRQRITWSSMACLPLGLRLEKKQIIIQLRPLDVPQRSCMDSIPDFRFEGFFETIQ